MNRSLRISLLLALAGLAVLLAAGACFPMPAVQTAAPMPLRQRDGYCLYAGEAAPAGERIHWTAEELNNGLLLYVGRGAALGADMPAQQARRVRSLVGLYVPAAERVALSEETIYALCALTQENPLVSAWITEGMRSPAEQTALQTNAFLRYQATLPLEAALRQAEEDVPPSGESEHQLATAFDVRLEGALDWSQADPMARTPDGRWLLQNGWRFGFIRRYPPDKAEITGVSGEALHWRYVGRAHAAAMHVLDVCLEEYLAALHQAGTLRLALPSGGSLWILCAAMGPDGADFSVPPGWQAAVSADRLGWAVCVLSQNSF